jgi:hypothetical protein
VDRPYRLVAVGHQARIDRAPFGAVLPHSGPGEDRLAADAEPCAGLEALLALGLAETLSAG